MRGAYYDISSGTTIISVDTGIPYQWDDAQLEASGEGTAFIAARRYSYDCLCVAVSEYTSIYADGIVSAGDGTDVAGLREYVGDGSADYLSLSGVRGDAVQAATYGIMSVAGGDVAHEAISRCEDEEGDIKECAGMGGEDGESYAISRYIDC